MTQQLRVLLGFTNAPDQQLEETAGAVNDGLTGNAAYPAPPVTMAALQTALTAFTTAIAAQAQGGTAATADKNNQRDALVGLLRQLAGYVQQNCNNDLALLLSSGFEAVGSRHTPAVLGPPNIRDILNGNSGQLILRVFTMQGVQLWKVRYAALGAGGAPGPWQDGGLHGDSRRIEINDLSPGTIYSFEAQAVVSGAKVSDWSDPVQHMSM